MPSHNADDDAPTEHINLNPADSPRRSRGHRVWTIAWRSAAGLVGLIAVIVILVNVFGSSSDPSTQAGSPPATTAPASSDPAPVPDPVDPTASPATLAKQGCEAYQHGPSIQIEDALAQKDLALAIRTVSAQAPSDPWVVANTALDDAGASATRYQPIANALDKLSDQITRSNPDDDLDPIGRDDALINQRCDAVTLH